MCNSCSAFRENITTEAIVASAVPQVDDRAMVIPNTHEVELDYQIATTPEQILHT